MVGDPLYEPLGTASPPPGRGRGRGFVWALAVVAVAGAGAAAWSAWRPTGRANQAVAVVPIEAGSPPAAALAAAPVAPPAPAVAVVAAADAPLAASPPGTTVEVQNGVKIVRFNPAASPASVTVPVDREAAGPLTPAPDPRVSEQTTGDGVLPRVGPDGLRPVDVYARPAVASLGPRVALLLTGMGADQTATADAGRRLDPDVTFGFGPDVPDAAAQVRETRRAGHEVFLDLAAVAESGSAASPSSVALRGSMGRFVGYAGVLLLPDAMSVSSAIAARGLPVLTEAAAPLPTGTGRAVMIDAGAGATATTAALDAVLTTARTSGAALGIVSHASLVTDLLSGFAGRAAARGVTLVPASNLLADKTLESRVGR